MGKLKDRSAAGRTASRRILAGLSVLVASAALAWQAGRALVISSPLPQPDAIVSLASHEWERLPVAARLARQYPTARVLLTQPATVSPKNCHRCAERVDDLVRLGVDRSRIDVLPAPVDNTYTEASAVRDAIHRMNARRVQVVTSAYHTRRALATFRTVLGAAGIAVGIVPADATVWAHPERWWTRPYDRWYVAYESVAIVSYRVRYGVPIFIDVRGSSGE